MYRCQTFEGANDKFRTDVLSQEKEGSRSSSDRGILRKEEMGKLIRKCTTISELAHVLRSYKQTSIGGG